MVKEVTRVEVAMVKVTRVEVAMVKAAAAVGRPRR